MHSCEWWRCWSACFHSLSVVACGSVINVDSSSVSVSALTHQSIAELTVARSSRPTRNFYLWPGGGLMIMSCGDLTDFPVIACLLAYCPARRSRMYVSMVDDAPPHEINVRFLTRALCWLRVGVGGWTTSMSVCLSVCVCVPATQHEGAQSLHRCTVRRRESVPRAGDFQEVPAHGPHGGTDALLVAWCVCLVWVSVLRAHCCCRHLDGPSKG